MKGTIGSWDYDSAIGYNKSETEQERGGFLRASVFRRVLSDGSYYFGDRSRNSDALYAELSPKVKRTGDTTNPGVRHAAFLTLDRLTLAEPAAMLEKLIPSATAQPETALMVSNLVARADVRDPAQRRLVEDYLLDEKRTAAELQAFTGVFPNANQFVSPNLLTKVAAIPGAELAARDRVALEVVTSWVHEPRFDRIQGALRGTHERLKSFVSP